jgi:hypothetical protein
MCIRKSWMRKAADLDQTMTLTDGGSVLRHSLIILMVFSLMI